MRILTGGHAVWMGGWSGQVHHHQDVIGPEGLDRKASVLAVLRDAAAELSPGTFLLPPAHALADSLIHGDHRVMPPDEIDPDYLEKDERQTLRDALSELGCSGEEAEALASPYDAVLGVSPDPNP